MAKTSGGVRTYRQGSSTYRNQDNNPFGEDDWDMLANEWDAEELNEWGFDV